MNSWLAGWTHTNAVNQKLPYLGAEVAQSKTLDRIRELATVGLNDDAQTEVKLALTTYGNDPRSLYALADVLSQLGWTNQSMAIAYKLLMVSPARTAYQSPIYLQRLVYPFPYQDIIEQQAKRYGVDPLLLVSLIRQESTFNTQARSSVNAIGLTQFMPTTAYQVAATLGMTNFTLNDLYVPKTSIEMGAAYLSAQIKQFGGNPFLALAAYNGGGGNVMNWLSDNPRHDLDLFIQEVPFPETQQYVENIYRFYQEYQTLYRPSATG